MARTRAADYDEKRLAILHKSALEFAKKGYDKTSMSQIARVCGVSKALLYHYYENKEGLLCDILRYHLQDLVDVVSEANDNSLEPKTRLNALCRALMRAYEGSDNEHKLQINEMSYLDDDRRQELYALERQLVAIFADAVAAANPHLEGKRELIKPITMSLFGMLNWSYLWLRPEGELTRDGYADLATQLLLSGSQTLKA
ncbi:TetR/AcrR family transcriptional regulator [Rhodobacteraceae bacterium RKSG542]|uniref:TetR/AcrR family transcriptional regulator n=1 Tax=Pseudovibrio flavus TaxID=2529854 RepID=UPI0012BB8EE1|nr:TetR/AcrR family transcriptional regulator [Pseudovibrio flavus]MTI16253.1 TetR/AcrR family transcriptional regulator [Pseudovibrio flavus]